MKRRNAIIVALTAACGYVCRAQDDKTFSSRINLQGTEYLTLYLAKGLVVKADGREVRLTSKEIMDALEEK